MRNSKRPYSAGRDARPLLSLAGEDARATLLRQSLHHSGQGFGQIVVDDHNRE
jgi:hypothetical protein